MSTNTKPAQVVMARSLLSCFGVLLIIAGYTCKPANVGKGFSQEESSTCSANMECVFATSCFSTSILELQNIAVFPCSNYGEPLKVCCPRQTITTLNNKTIISTTPSSKLTSTSKPKTTKKPNAANQLPSSTTPTSSVTISNKWSKLPSELREKTKLLPEDCGIGGYEDKIINGKASDIGQFPWMVLLGYEVNGARQFWCGGTLINNRYILTAAHCESVRQRTGTYKINTARLGEWNITSELDCVRLDNRVTECALPVIDVDVEQIIVHEKFGNKDLPSFQNDIALLRLSKTVNFTDFVRPVCLPPSILKNISSFTISGWGVSEVESVIGNPVLQFAPISLFNISECNSIAPEEFRPLSKSQFCAGGEAENACKGDSGGPLTYLSITDGRHFQKGIVSLGTSECGLEGKPTIYTEVSSYIKWILQNIRP